MSSILLEFDSNNSRREMTLDILDDFILEFDETFLARLSLENVQNGDPTRVDIDPPATTVTILDDDSE